MKTLEELKEIREQLRSQIDLRREDRAHTHVIVGMGTCGIACGAREVLITLSTLVQEKRLTDKFTVTQSGCIGICRYEPIIEVTAPGQEKVTYINMTPEKAAEVLERHLIGGQVIKAYTLDSADNK